VERFLISSWDILGCVAISKEASVGAGAVLEPVRDAAVEAVAVFEVIGSRSGGSRAVIMADGSLARVSPADAMAVWPVQQVTHLVVEEYALPPAAMQLRVHTSCGRVLRLRGEVPGDALMSLLRLESSLTIG
jgi:hypothetical protein